MPIAIACPTCGSKLKAPDTAAGKSVACPKCNARLSIPTVEVELSHHAVEKASKECPFCGEDIAASAKKCKHCGETLDATLRAAEEAKRASEKSPMVFMNAGGGASAAAAASGAGAGRGFPHTLHAVLTFFTCGLWLPVWVIHYLVSGR